MALQQSDEVVIFCHDDHALGRRRPKDRFVFSFAEVQIPNRYRLNGEAERDPDCKRGRQLGVEPDDHATTIG